MDVSMRGGASAAGPLPPSTGGGGGPDVGGAAGTLSALTKPDKRGGGSREPGALGGPSGACALASSSGVSELRALFNNSRTMVS